MRRVGLLLVISLPVACSHDVPRDAGVTHLAALFRTAAGQPVDVARTTLRGVGREGVTVEAGSPVSAAVNVPEGGTLRFAVAAAGESTAEVLLRAGASEVSLWRSGTANPGAWSPVRIDLEAQAGREVEIVLRVEGKPPVSVFFGAPIVAGRRGAHRNVLLYEVDTLRADLLEPFGYPGRTSPALGALVRRGTQFLSCYSTASWTRPAAASILTSRSVPSHGMVGERSTLPEGIPTLADALHDRGWYTVAFLTNPNAGRPAGLDRAFDVVFEMNGLLARLRDHADEWEGSPTMSTTSASGTTELVAFALAGLLDDWSDLPLFLYVHTMDPHSPYDPRAPFTKLSGYAIDDTSEAAGRIEPYAQDVRAGDHFLRRILGLLENQGLLHDTVIAYVSDHGEEFGDHGGRGHGRNLFVESLRVPFVLIAPGSVPVGRVLRDRVTVLDLLPTVLDLVGVRPPAGVEGRSLLPRLRDPVAGDPFPTQPAFSHVIALAMRIKPEAMADPDVIGHIAVMQGPWKCIVSEYGKHRKGHTRLYDLRADPGERNDVAADHPELAETMRAQALAWWSRGRAGAPGEERDLDPEFEEQLRALGYIE